MVWSQECTALVSLKFNALKYTTVLLCTCRVLLLYKKQYSRYVSPQHGHHGCTTGSTSGTSTTLRDSQAGQHSEQFEILGSAYTHGTRPHGPSAVEGAARWWPRRANRLRLHYICVRVHARVLGHVCTPRITLASYACSLGSLERACAPSLVEAQHANRSPCCSGCVVVASPLVSLETETVGCKANSAAFFFARLRRV